MSLEEKTAKFFKLTDKNWMRHSNPWSVWTRMPIIILLSIAIWCRDWIGYYSLIPIGLVIIWTLINPRIFPAPKTTKRWSSKAVFGERVWINRKKHPIPKHHMRAIVILNSISFSGMPFFIYGLLYLHFWATLVGILLILAGKLWFLDRMVWLYEEEKGKNEEYGSWEY